MEKRSSIPEYDAARTLLKALEGFDSIDCVVTRQLLPRLVEAECAGENVDAQPDYQPVFMHLETCEECLALYTQLSADLAVLGGNVQLPSITLPLPSFFPPPTRKGAHSILRLLNTAWQGFELTLALPQLAPALATLSGGTQQALFSDTLREVAGSPFVATSLGIRDGTITLRVAIRTPANSERWNVVLLFGETVLEAVTDERGIVQFDLPAARPLEAITLRCTILAA